MSSNRNADVPRLVVPVVFGASNGVLNVRSVELTIFSRVLVIKFVSNSAQFDFLFPADNPVKIDEKFEFTFELEIVDSGVKVFGTVM